MNEKMIDAWFSNHPATPRQRQAYELLWDSVRPVGHLFNRLIPDGEDKKHALLSLRTAVTAAITAIACSEPDLWCGEKAHDEAYRVLEHGDNA